MMQMEEVHKELAVKLTRAGLIDEVRDIEDGVIQLYITSRAKLGRMIRSSNARIKAAGQRVPGKDKEKTQQVCALEGRHKEKIPLVTISRSTRRAMTLRNRRGIAQGRREKATIRSCTKSRVTNGEGAKFAGALQGNDYGMHNLSKSGVDKRGTFI